MHSLAYELSDQYVSFGIAGKELAVPYAITTRGARKFGVGDLQQPAKVGRYANFAAKGSPDQIRKVLAKRALVKGFDLETASAEQIKSFMLGNGIGIDCSGFVYNVLDGYLRQTRQTSLDGLILRYRGTMEVLEKRLRKSNRVRRSSAATLTSELNSNRVDLAGEVSVGDMLRLTHPDWRGKHIAIVVETSKAKIVYAMSSDCTLIRGSHFAEIEILDGRRGLEHQRWLEMTKDGQDYGRYAFDPARGDSIRRLKLLDDR